MKKKIAISLVLALMALACLGGCAAKPSEPAQASQNQAAPAQTVEPAAPAETKVVVGLASDPQSIGPFQGMSAGRIGILYTVYEFLVSTEGGEMHGVLMKDYEKIDDLTYNCEIYDIIYDQAGNHVTAADVEYSYQMGMQSGNLPKLGSIASVSAISDYVIQFKFNELSIGDLGALWMECPIVTKAAYEASADQMATDPISTTAFKCTEFVSGSKMVFTNTKNYWQTDASKIRNTSKANVDVIEFDIITDSSQLTNALKSGAIHVTNWLSDIDVQDFNGAAGFAVSPLPDNTSYLLLYNCDEQQGVFASNLKFRQAIAYAIDNQQIIDGALNGNGNTAKTWGNTNYSDFLPDWLNQDYYEADIDKAKQLLAESGVTDLSLRLMIASGDTTTKMATIIQAQLAQIGVTVSISNFDAQLYNQYKNQPDPWDLMIDQGGSTSYLVNVWKLTWNNKAYVHGGTQNFVQDEKLQSLLEEALTTDNHNDASMDAFHQYLKEMCYGMAIAQPMTNIAHSQIISKIVVDARGQVTPGACSYAF
ncbi:MAG: ABC transporter substrate-binding protein [Clostridiales bacterium]|jgi:ABC-type transport system substrate-binding protein|nr:ABC transporter substrate-binding protein [Clostridiales bacterium]MDR2751396.1 ABC transporter substrate-binding protein [Clostridiales bacterium]